MKIHKTNAMRQLDEAKIPYEVLSYDHDPKEGVDGIHIASKLSLPMEKVCKTLVAKASTGEYLVYMIPVDKELDLKKCARAAGVKSVEMLPLRDLTKITGYIRGGCSPIGMKKQFRTFLDENPAIEEDIYFSAGKIGMQIHAKPEDIIQFLHIQTADLIS